MNTKEHIKNRMVKDAAMMWSVPANEIETSFDPIVTLLMAACASEIEKIANEVDDSQSRITEKVVQLMTPEITNGPRLAHAILYAEPIDEVTMVRPEYLFNYKKEQLYNKTSIKNKDIFFSPVRSFNLQNARVQFIATGDTIIELDNKNSNQNIVRSLTKSKLNPSTLYIGISSNLKTIFLRDVFLYFELMEGGNEELFYHHLRNTKWSVQNGKIDFIGGFDTDKAIQTSKLNSVFENVSDKTNTVCQQVINKYEKHYITLQSDSTKEIEKSQFNELEICLEENSIKSDANIRWVKIEFPRVIDNAILKHVKCSLNAFPVVNRALKSFSYSVKDYINIMPIKTEELFFDIKSIINTDGKEYRARSKDNSNMEKGTFVIRSNSVAKLDKRKAREYVLHLIELLKDESASFSFLDNDFLRSNLKVLNQVIALLEKKVSEASSNMVHTEYVALKPFKANENLLVDFWTTSGEEANNIKSGSVLSVYKGFGVKQGSCCLLTTVHGGKNQLNSQDRLNSSRRSLLSRNRVVTREDVKALCFELYGDKIGKVEIKRGYLKDIALKKGLVPCIEIVLTTNTEISTDDRELDSIGDDLRYFLEKNSINTLPFKIKILKKEAVNE